MLIFYHYVNIITHPANSNNQVQGTMTMLNKIESIQQCAAIKATGVLRSIPETPSWVQYCEDHLQLSSNTSNLEAAVARWWLEPWTKLSLKFMRKPHLNKSSDKAFFSAELIMSKLQSRPHLSSSTWSATVDYWWDTLILEVPKVFIRELGVIGPLVNWQVGHLSADYQPDLNALSMQFNCIIHYAHT